MINTKKRYWVVFKQDTGESEIFTARIDACKSTGISTVTLWRHEKHARYYQGNGFMVLFANGITKNYSRILKGKALKR